MSISLAQFAQAADKTDHVRAKEPSLQLPPKSTSRIVEPVALAVAPTPAEMPSPKVSTDLRIDAQHRLYYLVVNDHTGEVVCEIPCEEIRKLGEQSSAPPGGAAAVRRIDVKL